MTKLTVNDVVSVTNGYSVVLRGNRKIIGKDTTDQPRYFIEPTDTPWYSFPEVRLKLIHRPQPIPHVRDL